MKLHKPALSLCLTLILLMAGRSLSAQQIAYDDAGNYLVSANWTNGANQGFGFVPWAIFTNGPDFHGTYILSLNNPTFVIASVTNVLGTNYTDVWGLYAHGPTDINQTTAYRGFANPLGTNTFKLQWGSAGAGLQTTTNSGPVHGWCGFTLRHGNATNSVSDFQNGVQMYLYFLDGNIPSTLLFWDGNGVQSIPGTSFSNLGRNNITNAIEAEVTPAPDGVTYHLVLKDCVQNIVLFETNSIFISGGQTIDSAALFCQETTGDQVYNRMQITTPTNIPPDISNLQPADGSLYVNAGATNLSFEVDSFNSTVSSGAVSVYLNGTLLSGSIFNTASPTNQLLVTNNTPILPNTFYNYTVVAADAYGNVVSNNYTFNTFSSSNNMFIDAMDYNYGAGQFINPPGTALYSGLLGTNFIDYLDVTTLTNENNYRPEPGNPEPPSPPLPQLLPFGQNGNPTDPVDHEGFNTYNSGLTDYQLAYTDQGEWDNYTRVFPATNYTIYARAASASGGQFQLALLASPTATTSNEPLAVLGTFNVQNTGGSLVYGGQLSPLLDFFGNTVVMPLAGTNTLQQQATQSRTYNLSYVTFVTNTTAGTLRPYISIGSPGPNATGVGLTSPISFTLVNRQTSLKAVNSTNINLYLNGTNVSSRLVLSSNAVGATVTWTPTNNLTALVTNTVTVAFTDSANVAVTDSWTFITGTQGGALGNGQWSGGGGSNDMYWADAINWTGGTPGPGFDASFAIPGATTTLITNNIVATNVTILGLFYETNSSGYHTTWIQDGVTLSVSNPVTSSVAPILQVGAGLNADLVCTNVVTNTISGNGGTLILVGNPNPGVNELNFQVRASLSTAVPNAVTLDMSGLGTLNATIGKLTVGQGGGGAAQSNVTACVSLARTNVITLLRSTAGQLVVGDSSGAERNVPACLPGSTLNLGISNALYFGSMNVGKQLSTNNLVRFNPLFTSDAVPSLFIRGTNGSGSAVVFWNIGINNNEPSVPAFSQGVVDFSGGTVNALVGSMLLGQGGTNTADTGSAQGTFTFTAGTLNVNSLTNGWQLTNNTATETGILNVNGTATLISPSIMLAKRFGPANGALVTGTLNVTNGTVLANVIAGGGVSTVNVNGGTFVVSNSVGASAAPLTALNLVNASLHLKVNGSAPAANIFANTVTASGATIIIDSLANITGPTTIHLISYTGADPYAGLSLALLPFGYNGTLVDNSGSDSIDLNVTVASQQPPPTISNITLRNGQAILSGTNNFGAGGTYQVLTSTNIALPLSDWTVLPVQSFNANGNFSFTNSVSSRQQFYILQVP